MKQTILFLLFILASAPGFAQGFVVHNFRADVYISPDGYFDVVENYNIEFKQEKHGIFRDIITKFEFQDEKGKVSKREMYISNIEVPGEKFNVNKIFGKQFGDRITIRIGDKNTLVNGNKHYEIRYRVKNALFFTDDMVQFYWNIKPADWLTVFNRINFTIHTPDGASFSPANCFVYSGKTGNTEPSREFDYDYSGHTFSGKSKDNFLSLPQQNVTVLVNMPKSLVKEVDFTPPFWVRYQWLCTLGLVLLAIYTFIKIRLHLNRVIPVTSYYPPQGIDPAMAGYLIDNMPDSRDITCLLPYWATKGIIRMEEISKKEGLLFGDLKLIKLKALPPGSAEYESNLFQKIFGAKEEVLASTSRGGIGDPLRLLAENADKYYTDKKSKSRRLKLIVLALSELWAFFSIIFLPIFLRPYINIDSGYFIAFTIINFLFFFAVFPFGFAYIINKIRTKNELGKSIMPELLGFYQFIKIAEVERLKALLKEDPYYFEKTMPYAMAFNMLKEWTAKFDGLILQSPNWYTGSNTGTQFRFHVFSSSFVSSMAMAKTSMVVSPSRGGSSSSRSSSGGGSSGGGAGGGGGGSW